MEVFKINQNSEVGVRAHGQKPKKLVVSHGSSTARSVDFRRMVNETSRSRSRSLPCNKGRDSPMRVIGSTTEPRLKPGSEGRRVNLRYPTAPDVLRKQQQSLVNPLPPPNTPILYNDSTVW